ncbi:MAG: hypothetical protein ACJ746_08750 [Bryobacteraceae bacterium]
MTRDGPVRITRANHGLGRVIIQTRATAVELVFRVRRATHPTEDMHRKCQRTMKASLASNRDHCPYSRAVAASTSKAKPTPVADTVTVISFRLAGRVIAQSVMDRALKAGISRTESRTD